jgi:hypothetical protein
VHAGVVFVAASTPNIGRALYLELGAGIRTPRLAKGVGAGGNGVNKALLVLSNAFSFFLVYRRALCCLGLFYVGLFSVRFFSSTKPTVGVLNPATCAL